MKLWTRRRSCCSDSGSHLALLALLTTSCLLIVEGRIPSRHRVVRQRQEDGRYDRYRDNGRPIEGQHYRVLASTGSSIGKQQDPVHQRRRGQQQKDRREGQNQQIEGIQNDLSDEQEYLNFLAQRVLEGKEVPDEDAIRAFPFGRRAAEPSADSTENSVRATKALPEPRRSLSSQLTGCCSAYTYYNASDLCALYGQDCTSGKSQSRDEDDSSCAQEGLSFIGASFSVNTKYGNPYSYQLCDQFPMEKLIDRDYNYMLSMDEDGWLVGGGYKQFDYSGKMPYIDSSHTELLRIGSLDVNKGYALYQNAGNFMRAVLFCSPSEKNSKLSASHLICFVSS